VNAADVLDKAADVIVERGWCQGQFRNSAGQVCALAAVHTAARTTPFTWVADEALGIIRKRVGMSVAYWNDAPERTADEVITALRECAASLRASS